MSKHTEFGPVKCPPEMVDELAELATTHLVGILKVADKYKQNRTLTAEQAWLTFKAMIRWIDLERFPVEQDLDRVAPEGKS